MTRPRRPTKPVFESAAESLPQSQPTPWIAAAICGIGTLLYWLAFFADARRQSVWQQLLFPDDLLTVSWAHDLRLFGFFDRLPILLLAAWMSAAAYALGRWSLAACRLDGRLTKLEGRVLAVTIGYAWLSLGTLLIGLCGLLHASLPITVGILALGGLGCRMIGREFTATNQGLKPVRNRFLTCCWICGACFTAILLLGAMMPPWDFDVREYHLQAPKEWWARGRIEFLPHNLYASMPLATEMLALAAMTIAPGNDGWFTGALVGKTLAACFVPLTGLAIFATGKRYFSASAGAIGGLLYVSLPWIMQTGINGLNEPAVAAYGFLAFAMLLRVGDEPRAVIVAGFLAGAAAACKYPALVMIVAPLTIAAGVMSARSAGRPLSLPAGVRTAVLFLAAALAVCGPWFGKNLAQTGNPTYPLLGSVFGGLTRTPEKIERFERAHAVPIDRHGSRYGPAPLAAAVGQIGFASEGQSPLLIPFACAGLVSLAFGIRGDPSKVGLTAVGMVGWILAVWFFATHRIDRFWLPAAPFAAFLGGIAWESLRDRRLQIGLSVFLAIGLIFNVLFAMSPLGGDPHRFVALDKLRAGQALEKDDIPRVSPAFEYLNEHTSADRAVLLVGDAAVFDLRPPAFYNTCFDDSLFVAWTTNRSPGEVRAEFDRRNIEFVVVNRRELERYRNPGNYGYDPRFQFERIDELVRDGVLILEWTEPDVSRPTRIYRTAAAPP